MNHARGTNAVEPLVPLLHLDQLWFQVTGLQCNLTCTHCFISCSPTNHSFGFLSLDDVRARLEESIATGVKEYYFTGGEPFLHPDLTTMLVETLALGPATVLTNGTVLRPEWLERLQAAEAASRFSLEFRVSIDGFSAATNDPIRGPGTFDRAMRGVERLVEFGFLPIITAARTWDVSSDPEVVSQFVDRLKASGYSRPRLKILPTLRLGAEEHRTHGYAASERVSAAMLADYPVEQLLCSHARLVSDRGVHVCPILVEQPDSLLGQTLDESARPFALHHGACLTCYQYGAICSNAGDFAHAKPRESARHNGVDVVQLS